MEQRDRPRHRNQTLALAEELLEVLRDSGQTSDILDCCYFQTVGDISRVAVYFTRQDDLNVPFSDWIPTEELKTLSKYLIADLAALSIFKILIVYAGLLFSSFHEVIVNVEMSGLIFLIVAALILLIAKIIKLGVKGLWHGTSGIVLA
jgi:hypothetical protein